MSHSPTSKSISTGKTVRSSKLIKKAKRPQTKKAITTREASSPKSAGDSTSTKALSSSKRVDRAVDLPASSWSKISFPKMNKVSIQSENLAVNESGLNVHPQSAIKDRTVTEDMYSKTSTLMPSEKISIPSCKQPELQPYGDVPIGTDRVRVLTEADKRKRTRKTFLIIFFSALFFLIVTGVIITIVLLSSNSEESLNLKTTKFPRGSRLHVN